MFYPVPTTQRTPDLILALADRAARAIPPVWPLASSVAVNPYLGQSEESLAVAGARLARVAGASVTMPRSWYREKIASGIIADQDLEAALTAAPTRLRPADLNDLKSCIVKDAQVTPPLPTVADIAAEASAKDWPRLIVERISAWAAGYFDEGQALWAAPRGQSAFAAWRSTAMHDLTPEIAGLGGFASHVAEAPETALGSIARAAERLNLSDAALETYFHQLLMTLGGWAQYARYTLWQAELSGETDTTLFDLLAIRLIWEEALFDRYEAQIGERWDEIVDRHATPLEATVDHAIDTILQEAFERATQRSLAAMLAQKPVRKNGERPALQAAFCIDVRSETFRRALEGLNGMIQTLGFAGFFGLATAHRSFASDTVEKRLPVLLNPALASRSGGADDQPRDIAKRIGARATRAWGRFKLAAVSSFAFVEATGPVYISKLLEDALGMRTGAAEADPLPHLETALSTEEQIEAAGKILRAMSMTSNFARLVLLVGHGASVVNNPHASALNCGACGGYSGEVNVRLVASLLNDREVRRGLSSRGIDIPGDTLFLAALHDTTTDEVQIFEADHPTSLHVLDVERARGWLASAGKIARGERALRLPRAANERAVLKRSYDWSEVRPEWGLAGCKAFIAAPRYRTAGKDLAGRVFLHDYDWMQDKGFGVLELILTAPVVVASWISLQYYGSTVAPEVFGGGNKLLHNVTGGIGVVEGNGGLLRAGLPWQSIHDGEGYVHDPLRLTVCIEAPKEAITDVLARHENVRSLFDNRWLHLFTIDESGRLAARYRGELEWDEVGE